MTVTNKISIERYLEMVSRFSDSKYGKMVRDKFKDIKGSSELAMLAAPSEDEYEAFQRVVAVMNRQEKENVELLGDEQIKDIAKRAQVDCGATGIFLNGYILARKNQNANMQEKE